jgi:hypothetical protein
MKKTLICLMFIAQSAFGSSNHPEKKAPAPAGTKVVCLANLNEQDRLALANAMGETEHDKQHRTIDLKHLGVTLAVTPFDNKRHKFAHTEQETAFFRSLSNVQAAIFDAYKNKASVTVLVNENQVDGRRSLFNQPLDMKTNNIEAVAVTVELFDRFNQRTANGTSDIIAAQERANRRLQQILYFGLPATFAAGCATTYLIMTRNK